MLSVRADIDANDLTAPIVRHVGGGNFHVLFVIDPDDAGALVRAEAVYARMIAHALACGGTCTGEHGVGAVKRKHLIEEHGEDAVATMRTLKRVLDPLNLMNPGKVLPEPAPAG